VKSLIDDLKARQNCQFCAALSKGTLSLRLKIPFSPVLSAPGHLMVEFYALNLHPGSRHWPAGAGMEDGVAIECFALQGNVGHRQSPFIGRVAKS
jgi:hypothetical protein